MQSKFGRRRRWRVGRYGRGLLGDGRLGIGGYFIREGKMEMDELEVGEISGEGEIDDGIVEGLWGKGKGRFGGGDSERRIVGAERKGRKGIRGCIWIIV